MRRKPSSCAAIAALLLLFIGAAALLQVQARAQASAPQLPQVAPPPYDPYEPVTTQPKRIERSKSRTAQNLALRRVLQRREFEGAKEPYTVNISFTASGDVKELGPGEMEETRNEVGARRWTGRLGNYSLSRIITEGVYDLGSPGPIPMRLMMARLYSLGVPLSPTRFIRTADGTLNGASLNCILASDRPSFTPARDWSETEYCIDARSKQLDIYSAAPGIYAIFGYTGAIFHGRTVPDRVTITEGGQVVLDGNIQVRDPEPGALAPEFFTPTSRMISDGVHLAEPIRHIQFRTSNPLPGSQPVVVHATLAPDGTVVEAESLQTLDPELSRTAVELVRATKYTDTARYASPPQLELFVTVE